MSSRRAAQFDKTWFKMPACAWSSAPAAEHGIRDIESGDKLILHTGILHQLMTRFGDRPLPSPFMFEIQNVAERHLSHCGVLEFSSPNSTAFLPRWMMSNLHLTDGQEIQIRLKELPTATDLTIQPLRYDFGQIPTPKVALEHALRSFTALTVGDTIAIRVGANTHALNVKEVKPEAKRAAGQANAACVVGAHLRVEILPALEPEPESAKPVVLELDQSTTGQAEADTYRYYRCKTSDLTSAVEIELRVREGDPELVVSMRNDKPTLADCTWKSVGTAVSASASAAVSTPAAATVKRVLINPTSLGFAVGWYYIGVFAYKIAATFDITMREIAPPDTSIQAPPSGASVGSATTSADPTAKQCDTCRAFISAKAYSLHTMQCARMNVYCAICAKPIRKSEQATHAHCDICQAVMHPADLAKHLDLVHKSIACPACGEAVDPSAMVHHRAELCRERPATCRWCTLELAHRLLADHEAFCGATTDVCERCHKDVPRRKMDIHLAVDHGVNISRRPDERSSMGQTAFASSAAVPLAQPRNPEPEEDEDAHADEQDHEDGDHDDAGEPSWDEEDDDDAGAGGEGDDRCPYCDARFPSFAALEQHMPACPQNED